MSVGIVNKSTGDRIPTAGDPLDKVGNLANLTTTAKTNAVAAINEVNAGLAGKQATLTFDSAPTDGSTNPVESNGVYDALALKQDKTDNTLETTSKTIVGAVNELKSGLTNYEAQNDLNLEVPNRINLLNPLGFINGLLDNTTGDLTSTNKWLTSDFINVFDKSVILSGWKLSTKNCCCVRFIQYDKNKAFVGSNSNIDISGDAEWHHIVTLDSATQYIRVSVGYGDNENIDANDYFTNCNMQLEHGSTATTFAPYIPSVESRIEALNTVTSSTAGGFGVFTVGKLVMLNKKDGGTDTDASGNVLYNGEILVLPSNIRPVELVTVLDAYSKKRIQIKTNGNVVLPDDASATNLTLRFTAIYLTS